MLLHGGRLPYLLIRSRENNQTIRCYYFHLLGHAIRDRQWKKHVEHLH